VRAAGYRKLQPDEILLLRAHGVSTDMIHDVVALGYGQLPPGEIARMRDHGVTASTIRRAQQLTGRPSVDEIIRLRDLGTI